MRAPHCRSSISFGTAVRRLGSVILVAATSLAAGGACAQQPARSARDSSPSGQRSAAGPTTVVVLVRHAEKAAPTGDVALSPAGEARAAALAAALRDAGVQAVLTTQLRRTGQTAEPLAAAMGLTPEIVPIGGDAPEHAARVAAAVRQRHQGHTVLVVGHSNTVPAIIAALGGPRIPDLCDSEYATLFVLVARDPARAGAADGAAAQPGPSAQLLRSSYGAPDSSSATCGGTMAPPR
jgi:phosphohistidine phosphatase SixA